VALRTPFPALSFRTLDSPEPRQGRRVARSADQTGPTETTGEPKMRAEMRKHCLDPAHHLVDGELDFTTAETMAIMQLLNEDLTIGGLSDTPFIINKKSPRS